MPLTYSSVFKAQDVEDLAAPINLLAAALNAAGVTVSDSVRVTVWRECLQHHALHISTLRVNQHAIDPYKLITWYGYILAYTIATSGFADASTTTRKVVEATLGTLNYCLENEVPAGGLGSNTISYMADLVINEIEGKPTCGIGKNGLFLAFHTASTMKRKSRSSFSSGWANS